MKATAESKQAKARAELIVEGVRKDLEAKYPGYTVKTKCAYDPDGTNLRFTVTMAIISAEGVPQDKENDTLKQMAHIYGWSDEAVNKEVTIPGHGKCKLVGYNSRAPKRPWLIRTANGKTLVGEHFHVQMYWGLKLPEWLVA